jgi:hypothetical protein
MRALWAISALLLVSRIGICGAVAAEVPLPTSRAEASYRCDRDRCAMPADSTYPYVVIGTFVGNASREESVRLYSEMRERGHWQALPSDVERFSETLQPVSIALESGGSLAFLMTQEEAKAVPIQVGDLVRYSPHRGTHEIPPTDPAERSYWAIDGCVAMICRASDKQCFDRYRSGIYRIPDGVALSPSTFKPRAGKAAIDLDTLLSKDSPGNASGR